MIDIYRHCVRGQENGKDEARNMTVGQTADSHWRPDKAQLSEGGGYTVRGVPLGILGAWLLDTDGICFACARNGTLYSTSKHSATEPHRGTLRLVFAADGRTQERAIARQAGGRIKKSCTEKQNSGSRRIFPQEQGPRDDI